MDAHGPGQESNRRNIAVLFITLVIVMLGFGMVIPIIPFYVEHFGAGGMELGILMSIFSIMQLIFAPLWGSVSDRVGRKPVLLLGVLGNGLSMAAFGLSTELWMLFASRALSGVLSSATIPTSMAYIGDSTSHRDRGSGMGIMGAAMGVGMMLGPGIGGWLAGQSLATPFFASAALSFATMLPIYLFLPESLSTHARQRLAASGKGPGLVRLLRSLSGPMANLMVMAFLTNFALTSFQGVFGLFALKKFAYSPQQVGSVLVMLGLVSGVTQGVLSGPLISRWGEVALLRASLLLSAAGYLVMLLATNFTTVMLTTGVFALGTSLLMPVVAALTSKQATMGQGATMGLSNSFMSLGRAIGPLWAGFIFDVDVDYPYLSGAIVMLASFVASLAWAFESRPEVPADQPARID